MTAHLIQRGTLNPSQALIAVDVFGQTVDPAINLQIRDVSLHLCQLT